MLNVLIPIAVILITIAFAIGKSMAIQRASTSRHQWAFAFIHSTQHLVKHIQQHRGMANALLRGDDSFREKLSSLQAMIDANFIDLNKACEKDLATVGPAELEPIRTEWQAIREQVLGLSPEISFSRHSLLISRLLDMIEDASELTSLYEYGAKDKLLIQAIATDLPRLTEFLGQARGLGTGVAAQGHSSVAEQLKLKFLTDKCHNVFENTLDPLQYSNNVSIASQESAFGKCLEKGRDFIAMVRNEFLDADEIRVDPAQYYADATQAIEESFHLFDSLLLAVRN